jgi:hypothetical protein
MSWSNSKVFAAFLTDALAGTAAFDLNSDTFKVALYDNDITPANDVAAANSAYNAGQWTSASNEVSESGQWATGGVALTSPTCTFTSTTVTFDASDTASGSAADLANVYGCLVYDDTLTTPVADQGVCYNYLGGANSVVNGTFTVVWSSSGIASFSVA